MRNPFGSTGWIIEETAKGPVFRGTCFGFRESGFLLTAAHCVTGADARKFTLGIWGNPVERGLSIKKIIPHPTADIALVRFNDTLDVFDRFVDLRDDCEFGAEVAAFGYPEDTGERGMEPTPRYFRGCLQRRFFHTSPYGYKYLAGELSFSAPGGLSGGPVALREEPELAVGVVCENVRSSTYLETTTDVRAGKTHYREEVHAVINYGICVLLEGVADWLDEHVPRHRLGVRPAGTRRSSREAEPK